MTARIDENTRLTKQTEQGLAASRGVLLMRLRDLYATPEPSLAEVLITSGSITAAATSSTESAGRDAEVVGGQRDHKAQLERLRMQLEADRTSAADAVAARERAKNRVEGLPSREY